MKAMNVKTYLLNPGTERHLPVQDLELHNRYIIFTPLLRTRRDVYSHIAKASKHCGGNLNPPHKEERKVCRLSLAQALVININPTSTVGLKRAASHACVNPPSGITDETTSFAFIDE